MRLVRIPFLLLCTALASVLVFSQSNVVTYQGTNDIFPNPERGPYVDSEVEIGTTQLRSTTMQNARTNGMSIVNRYYYLTPYVASPLSQGALDFITRDLTTIREGGMKCILKFAYTRMPNQIEAHVDTMMRHLEQLRPVLSANADVIAAIQAGFIGPWGEWHDSYYAYQDSPRVRQAIIEKLLDILPESRMVCIRTPRFKRAIYGTVPLTETEVVLGLGSSRVGHHNDCFLKSRDDAGTYYLPGTPNDTGITRQYLAEDSRFLIVGGETCGPSYRSNCATGLDEMARFHFSFLNSYYHPDVIDSFMIQGCWEEISRRLGYRLTLIRTEITSRTNAGGTFHVRVELENDGFAAPFNPRGVELILRNQATSQIHRLVLSANPRFWAPGTPIVLDTIASIPPQLPAGTYQVLLNLPDPEPRLYGRPEYSIRVANASVWEAATGFNNLLTNIVIDTTGSVPPSPLLATPPDNAIDQPTNLTLRWSAVSGASRYHAQLSTDSTFQSVSRQDSMLTDTSWALADLSPTTVFYWRTRTISGASQGTFSSHFRFRSGTVSGSGEDPGQVRQFRLSQNYPNPFNPTTTVTYAVPVRSHVRIVVTDILGRERNILVDRVAEIGEYAVTISAEGLASGVYMYTMTGVPLDASGSETFSDSRMFVLMR